MIIYANSIAHELFHYIFYHHEKMCLLKLHHIPDFIAADRSFRLRVVAASRSYPHIRGNCDNTLTAGAIRRARRIIRLMKILITETWNPPGNVKWSRAPSRSIKRPLCLANSDRYRSGIARLRGRFHVFLRRHPQHTAAVSVAETKFTPTGCRPGPRSSSRSNALEIPLLPHDNTLDRAGSRLSVWLPRIMDVTVTHVNEACHLHLLRLRRLTYSLRILICSSGDTSPSSPSYILPSLGINRSRERLRCLPCSISSAGSRATSLPSFLPAFIGVNTTPAEVRIRLAEVAYSGRSAPAVTPIRDARVEETEANVQTLTGFDERTARTLRDHKRPMILECRPTNSGSVWGCPPADW